MRTLWRHPIGLKSVQVVGQNRLPHLDAVNPCDDGKIAIPHANDTPEEVRCLFSETYVNANGETGFTQRTADFLEKIRI
jgi:hypothetical protein